jgi:DNA-binding Lrp family transcriptional regulator
MVKACVLVKTVPNVTDKVLANIKKMSGVRKAYAAIGRWDIVVFVDASTEETRTIAVSINSIDGVRSTETLPQA